MITVIIQLMTAKKQKYYVVWHVHTPGVYTTCYKALSQVKNFPNAMYKAFESLEDAQEAFGSGPQAQKKKTFQKPDHNSFNAKSYITPSISVDAACSGNPGAMEYRGVWTSDKTEIFHFGPVNNGTNNIGEFLAIVHALALLKKQNDDK